MIMKRTIWIDMLNPSHPLFFRPLVEDLGKDHEVVLTVRERGETVGLAEDLGLKGRRIGRDHDGPMRKTLSIVTRTVALAVKVGRFDTALSFENPMSVAVSKLRFKRSILLLDNDLKMKIKGNPIQKMETHVKFKADHIIVPACCEGTFSRLVSANRLMTYDGFKEDIYISDYRPDPHFQDSIPFKDYLVVRPEALASFYVENKNTIVPELVRSLLDRGQRIVFLPRSANDRKLVEGLDVFIPERPLNGLDLIHGSKAVLTGSGTMAREGAVMGRPSVSFFPNDTLLTVDEEMIKKGLMFHSRDVDEIIGYISDRVAYASGSSEDIDLSRSKKVRDELFSMIRSLV